MYSHQRIPKAAQEGSGSHMAPVLPLRCELRGGGLGGVGRVLHDVRQRHPTRRPFGGSRPRWMAVVGV